MFRQIFKYLSFRNGIQIILNRVFFNRTGPTVYSYSGMTFLVDHSAGDQDGPRACIIPGLYDPFLSAMNLDSPVNFIDLGANAGGFVLSLLKHDHTIRKGICVELNPITWSRLTYNLFANVVGAYNKIVILNGAVSSSDGHIDIKLGQGSVGDNIQGSNQGTLYQLPTYSLETVLNLFDGSPIDILKIDIEGAEYELRETCPSHLSKVKYILIEIHDMEGHEQSEISNWIESMGFTSVNPTFTPVENNVFLYRRDTHQ
jgi:FkbM family methyltransferase